MVPDPTGKSGWSWMKTTYKGQTRGHGERHVRAVNESTGCGGEAPRTSVRRKPVDPNSFLLFFDDRMKQRDGSTALHARVGSSQAVPRAAKSAVHRPYSPACAMMVMPQAQGGWCGPRCATSGLNAPPCPWATPATPVACIGAGPIRPGWWCAGFRAWGRSAPSSSFRSGSVRR